MKPEAARDSTRTVAHLARLLPFPAERELPGSRHRVLKEYLMQEIMDETRAADSTPGRLGRPRRSRRRLAYFAAPLVAASAFAAFAITANGGTSSDGPATARQTTATGHGTPTVGSNALPNTPTTLLGRIAEVAAAKPLPTVRDDQFVYVESKVAFEVDTQDSTGYHSKLAPLHLRQIWLSVNDSRTGLLRESGSDVPLPPPPQQPNLNGPDYRYLQTLPTEPSVLLKKIYAETGNSAPRAFGAIGDLLREQIAPPAVTAALYRAAALIPGVRVIHDVVDVTGQHDVAVALDYATATMEWLFSPSSLDYAGEQTISTKAGPLGPAGSVVGTQIILDRAIVDRAGETPAQSAQSAG